MKRLIPLILAVALLLCACAQPDKDRTILVSVAETPDCEILDNGKFVTPGSDVTFVIAPAAGFALSGVDYSGEYKIWQSEGETRLELKQVRYPTRLKLTMIPTDSVIRFEPNGGEGEALLVTRDLRYHVRPNTAPAIFDRPGYSLVSWNTEPDGSGLCVGLGSRITNPESGKITLYAQWLPWSNEEDFAVTDGKITAYTGTEETLVIPETVSGQTVTGIASGAFQNVGAKEIVLPKTLENVEAGAFSNCAVEQLTFYDSILFLPSNAFLECNHLKTLCINAQRPPFGSHFRRESVLADKLDLLILNQGKPKIVFYGGCSMWYNLDGKQMQEAVGSSYQVVNAAVNGLINSAVQMQILTSLLEPGDIFFHTPELSSDTQLLCQMGFTGDDTKLWCGLEYNYDLLKSVDLRDFPGLLDSYQMWRSRKNETGNYDEHFEDASGNVYFDPETGCIPFQRYEQSEELLDKVDLKPERIGKENMQRLADYYEKIQKKGARVYVSCACINLDVVPEEQQGTIREVESAFREAVQDMPGVAWISSQADYLYRNEDFFDTNYHLLTHMVQKNTEKWIRDLEKQLKADGLWQ